MKRLETAPVDVGLTLWPNTWPSLAGNAACSLGRNRGRTLESEPAAADHRKVHEGGWRIERRKDGRFVTIPPEMRSGGKPPS